MKILSKVLYVAICIAVAVMFFMVGFTGSLVGTFRHARTPWNVRWNDTVGNIYHDIDLNENEQTGYDLYVPANVNTEKNYSLILYIHGGGFTSGDKADGEYLCKYYASKGYVCASVNYTLEDGVHTSNLNLMYDQIHEQVVSIKDKAEELGFHVTEMATTGESAGGCLAMLYAYREPENSVIPVKFVFQMTGPATFEPKEWASNSSEEEADFLTMMSGTTVTAAMMENGDYKRIVNWISPAALVNENTVPTLMAYGSKDKIVPVGLKYSLIAAFDQYNVPYTYIEFPNSGHPMLFDKDKMQEYANQIDVYLERYFENCTH